MPETVRLERPKTPKEKVSMKKTLSSFANTCKSILTSANPVPTFKSGSG